MPPLSIPFIPAPAMGTPALHWAPFAAAGTALQSGPNKTSPLRSFSGPLLSKPPFGEDLSQVFFSTLLFKKKKAGLFLGIFSRRLK